MLDEKRGNQAGHKGIGMPPQSGMLAGYCGTLRILIEVLLVAEHLDGVGRGCQVQCPPQPLKAEVVLALGRPQAASFVHSPAILWTAIRDRCEG